MGRSADQPLQVPPGRDIRLADVDPDFHEDLDREAAQAEPRRHGQETGAHDHGGDAPEQGEGEYPAENGQHRADEYGKQLYRLGARERETGDTHDEGDPDP